jgi:hypothetical protein
LSEFLISAFALLKGPDRCFAVCRTYDKENDQHFLAIPTRASLNELMRTESKSESGYSPIALHMVHFEYGEEHKLRWHVLLTTDEVNSMIKSTQLDNPRPILASPPGQLPNVLGLISILPQVSLNLPSLPIGQERPMHR